MMPKPTLWRHLKGYHKISAPNSKNAPRVVPSRHRQRLARQRVAAATAAAGPVEARAVARVASLSQVGGGGGGRVATLDARLL